MQNREVQQFKKTVVDIVFKNQINFLRMIPKWKPVLQDWNCWWKNLLFFSLKKIFWEKKNYVWLTDQSANQDLTSPEEIQRDSVQGFNAVTSSGDEYFLSFLWFNDVFHPRATARNQSKTAWFPTSHNIVVLEKHRTRLIRFKKQEMFSFITLWNDWWWWFTLFFTIHLIDKHILHEFK